MSGLIAPLRRSFVPWPTIKKLTTVLDPPTRDPLAAALARSSNSDYPASSPLSPVSTPSSNPTPLPRSSQGSPSPTRLNESTTIYPTPNTHSRPWKCQIMVHAPIPPVVEVPSKGSKVDKNKTPACAEHLIRANSLAGYWELNRRLIRNLPTGPGSVARIASTEEGAISSSAQISPDSIIGQGTRAGERASIKKCVVGRHCVIGRGAKLTGCVLWDFVVVEEK